mgnify:CR=1 FL=1
MNFEYGSSPLARGLLNLPGVRKSVGRIIPARAGFTTIPVGRLALIGDHPRSRGVYDDRGAQCPGVGGSSPLARGLRVSCGFRRRGPRIIPARAGFTVRRG